VSRQLYQVCDQKREVYGLGKRHISTMQSTTAVSADVPTQTKHITKGRSVWVEGATRLHDADDHYSFCGPDMPGRMQKSMDWGSDTAPRCRRPLQFLLTCQQRHNISRIVEVYGLRKRHGSMTQTTTTVSSAWWACQQECRSLWIGEATRLHNAAL